MVQHTKTYQFNSLYNPTERKKNHRIISLKLKKSLTKFNSPYDKSLGESRDTMNIPKHNKGSIQQANIKLNEEKFKAIPVKPGTRQGCSRSLYLFNTVLEGLARAIRQQKEIKGIQIRKEKVNLTIR